MSRFGCRIIGIDLGTANTLVCLDGHGVSVRPPSLVTVNHCTGEIEAVGWEAEAGCGRTPRKLYAVRPLRRGMIYDLSLCEEMLSRFLYGISPAHGLGWTRVVAAVPGELTEVERLALAESLKRVGATSVMLTDQILAAAYGAGLPVAEPRGRMVIDVGAGVTGIAVISMASVVQGGSVAVAGDEFDTAIAAHVRGRHQLLIGERTAERIKMEAGSACPLTGRLTVTAKGRCLGDGIPREVTLSDVDIREALAPSIQQILGAVRKVLEQAPPELCADLVENGILLTGGSALLRYLDRCIYREFGLPVHVAAEPLLTVIHGLTYQLRRPRGSGWRRFGHVS